MSAVLPSFQDRPQTLPGPDGWVWNVAIRDAAHMEGLKQRKRELAEAHPDAGGSSFRFRLVMRKWEKWEKAEVAFYAQIKLNPPVQQRHEPPPETFTRVLLEAARPSKALRTRRRLEAYLEQHPDASSTEVGHAIGITREYANVIRHRLRQPQKPRPLNGQQRMAAILADGQPHTKHELALALGCSVTDVSRYIKRLRDKAFDMETLRRSGHASAYRLVIPRKERTA